jgi:hypothetical protein
LSTEQDSGERRLWLAVIERALKDLHSTDWRIQDEARVFLTRSSRDLYMVCDLVGFDAQAVMEAAHYIEDLGESDGEVYLQRLLDDED